MLPKILSAVGLAFIVAALVGFALPLSTAPAGKVSEAYVLSGVEEPSNTNDHPTPSPSATPVGTPSPTPTPRPTPVATPTPTSTSEDSALKNTVEANLTKAGVSGVTVEVRDGVVTLKGEVPEGKFDDALKAARSARAKGVNVAELKKTGVSKPTKKADPRVSPEGAPRKAPDTVMPPRPKETTHSEFLIEIRADAPERSSVEIEWPGRLDMKSTGTIRVSLVNETGVPSPPVTDIPGSNVNKSPLPAGCLPQGKSLANAYGPQFEANASAKLTTAPADFDVQPGADGEQPVDPSKTTWTWLITPKSSGSHNVALSASVRWKERRGGREKPACTILNRSLTVYVEDTWYNEGNLKTAQSLVGIAGLVLQLPIFLWLRRKGKKGEDKDGETEGEPEKPEKKD
jgi:hypothetical protein